MNHLNKEISKFGIDCVINHWREMKLHPPVSDRNTGLFYCESPLDLGEKFFSKIMTKASDKNKMGVHIFGMNQEECDLLRSLGQSIKERIQIIHVDARTSTIGVAFLDDLMKPYKDGHWTFPYLESNPRLGKLIYWSSWQLKDVATLTEEEKATLVMLRTKNKSPKNQQSIFD